MDTWYITATTIIIIVLYILDLILTKTFPAFFSEYGKNLATKRDIGEITKLVEQAKIDFTKQTEELKAQLLFVNQHKLSWKLAERDAIADFNKKLLSWIYFIEGFRLRTFNGKNYQDLKNENLEIRKKQIDFNISKAHLSVFIVDSMFVELRDDVVEKLTDYSETLKSGMVNIFSLYSEIDFWEFREPSEDKDILNARRQEFAKYLGAIENEYKTNEKKLKEIYIELQNKHVALNNFIYNRLKNLDNRE